MLAGRVLYGFYAALFDAAEKSVANKILSTEKASQLLSYDTSTT
jgi:hypothetical protein